MQTQIQIQINSDANPEHTSDHSRVCLPSLPTSSTDTDRRRTYTSPFPRWQLGCKIFHLVDPKCLPCETHTQTIVGLWEGWCFAHQLNQIEGKCIDLQSRLSKKEDKRCKQKAPKLQTTSVSNEHCSTNNVTVCYFFNENQCFDKQRDISNRQCEHAMSFSLLINKAGVHHS